MGKDWRSKRSGRRDQRENKLQRVRKWMKNEWHLSSESDEWIEEFSKRIVDNPKNCRCSMCKGGRKGHHGFTKRHEPLEEKDNDTNE